MIDTTKGLLNVVDRIRQADAVAIDTEFVWERTYYPELGVIQIALSSGEIFLLDAVALDLRPLGEILSAESVVKVLHDAIQDLAILRQATGTYPNTVFDTQRASGFVGLPSTVSLQDLVEEVCGVSLSKQETRTNWLKRPLTQEQITYAEDDVRHLLRVHEWLLKRIDSLGRTSWIEEEMAEYDDKELYKDSDPDEQYIRVKGRGLSRLSPKQRAVLRELAAWRETEARRANVPRKHVIDDSAIIDLARRYKKAGTLTENRHLKKQQWQTYREEIRSAIERASQMPSSELPPLPGRPDDDERLQALTQISQSILAGRCHREKLDPLLVATKSELRELVDAAKNGSTDSIRVASGWRRDFIGDDLLSFLDGDMNLTISRSDGWPELSK